MHIYREGLFHYKAYVADMQAGFTKRVRPNGPTDGHIK